MNLEKRGKYTKPKLPSDNEKRTEILKGNTRAEKTTNRHVSIVDEKVSFFFVRFSLPFPFLQLLSPFLFYKFIENFTCL